jgi:ribosomal protein S18 acetylase RimI-like enzyme
MTVGTRPEYARCGVGSALLNAIKADAQTQPGCCAVYLHVIHYNAAAMSFYEKHGFTRLRHLRQFYSIGDSHHNAYLYILYINGYRLPLLSRILERARYVRTRVSTLLLCSALCNC